MQIKSNCCSRYFKWILWFSLSFYFFSSFLITNYKPTNSISRNTASKTNHSRAFIEEPSLLQHTHNPQGVLDVLAYTDTDVAVPFTWVESDPKLIANPQTVKLHSFDAEIHKVDTLVSYKNDEWDEA